MSRKIGFWSVFALVTGSQIGSGVFMLPSSLAPYGAFGLAGWILSGLGAVMLALVFAQLCARLPRTGGPHVYVQEAFGPTMGFFTGWTYWIISWVSSIAVITASIGYLTPIIGEHSLFTHFALEVGLLFIITWINLKGVKAAGNAEFFLSALKMIPLLVLPIVALFFFKSSHIATVTPSAMGGTSHILSHVTLLTLWGFVGLESGTTPAGAVQNPSKTIPRAVILGTLCVAGLYFINSIGIMGALPASVLMNSKAPFADATQAMFGGNWHLIISLIAAIVCIGTLNAWMLASGQIALGVAQDDLMPAFFARTNKQGAPYCALLVSCAGIVPLLFLTLNENIAQQINTIIDFSVICFLFVYVICCGSLLKLLAKQQSKDWKIWLYSLCALSFCAWVISATPLKTIAVASLFVLSGIPIYFMQRRKFNLEALPVGDTV